jgi:hypothetical protein
VQLLLLRRRCLPPPVAACTRSKALINEAVLCWEHSILQGPICLLPAGCRFWLCASCLRSAERGSVGHQLAAALKVLGSGSVEAQCTCGVAAWNTVWLSALVGPVGCVGGPTPCVGPVLVQPGLSPLPPTQPRSTKGLPRNDGNKQPVSLPRTQPRSKDGRSLRPRARPLPGPPRHAGARRM